ncbi:hypothetical protein ACIHCQ_04080 [Streptomyces sp. NPDC052236]|uniref:hypothetical protein n=1 Tax=Streptomyces sp. NPDC052236 TaxID=3365686 RepID=UPI0037D243DA
MRPAALLAAGALLVTGCAQSVDPIERLGRRAAQQVSPGARSAPYAVDRVPTRDKVVFLASDERAVRDPRFVRMRGELKLPVSVFRTAGRPGPVPGRVYAEGERLRPGDVVRAEPGTLALLLRRVQEQGYAVARLEDYVRPRPTPGKSGDRAAAPP